MARTKVGGQLIIALSRKRREPESRNRREKVRFATKIIVKVLWKAITYLLPKGAGIGRGKIHLGKKQRVAVPMLFTTTLPFAARQPSGAIKRKQNASGLVTCKNVNMEDKLTESTRQKGDSGSSGLDLLRINEGEKPISELEEAGAVSSPHNLYLLSHRADFHGA